MAQYGYQIGLTLENLMNVEDMTPPIPAPRSVYQAYRSRVELGSGGVRGLGLPSVTWHWGFLTLAQKTALGAFCGALAVSQKVYIRTLEAGLASETYATFEATLVWPEQEERAAAGRRLEFTLEFIHLRRIYP